jgi:hypothetical protein
MVFFPLSGAALGTVREAFHDIGVRLAAQNRAAGGGLNVRWFK